MRTITFSLKVLILLMFIQGCSGNGFREYLVFLKIEYSIVPKQSPLRNSQLASKRRIHIDRSYLYDSDFALGKSEEEKRVKKTLYEEAARLILLRLKYSK